MKNVAIAAAAALFVSTHASAEEKCEPRAVQACICDDNAPRGYMVCGAEGDWSPCRCDKPSTEPFSTPLTIVGAILGSFSLAPILAGVLALTDNEDGGHQQFGGTLLAVGGVGALSGMAFALIGSREVTVASGVVLDAGAMRLSF